MAKAQTAQTKSKGYEVNANLRITVGVTIQANSLEEAVAKSKELTVADYIDFNGNNHIDSDSPDVYGVWRND